MLSAQQHTGRIKKLSAEEREQLGIAVLRIYFHQLMRHEFAILDLRSSTWLTEENGIHWSPGNLYADWDPVFLNALRGMYSGFYDDQSDTFREALQGIGLLSVESEIRKQFTFDRDRKKLFRVKDFIASFHQIFLACKKAKVSLHPNFLPLGIMLSGLYETLEILDREFDVESCFRLGCAS